MPDAATIPAGGAADVILRMVGPRIAEGLGQPLVIENRPAMAGVLASEQVAQMPPDGYNLLFTTPSSQITVKFLSKNVRYDGEKDFTPITMVVEPATFLVVHPSVPVTSVKALIAYARANPQALSYGSSGPGSANHLAGELFKSMAGVSMIHVPYKGSGPSTTAFLSGEVQTHGDLPQEDMFRRRQSRFVEENIAHNLKLLSALDEVRAESGGTRAQLALAWCLHRPWDVLPIPGSTKMKHLKDNAAAADIRLTPAQVAKLDAAFAPGAAKGSGAGGAIPAKN